MSNRFSKIDAQGAALPLDATEWVAVYDATSCLMWSRDDVTEKPATHDQATKACAELELAGATDWRLPTVEELFALADRTRQEPAIDTAFFPKCASDLYWTSTPAAWSPSSAWFVNFDGGSASGDLRLNELCVRAVRSVSPSGQ